MFDKRTIDVLFKAAEELGLKPEILTRYGLVAIEYQDKTYYLFHSNSPLNNNLSAQLALNKHMTRTILARIKAPNIPYCLPASLDEAITFLHLHKVVIAKPTKGGQSQDINLITDENQFSGLSLKNYILEKYVKGVEMRYLVINDEVRAVHRKYYETIINDPDTVKRISYPRSEWDKHLVTLSQQICEEMQLNFAAVDYLVTDEGPYVLEVNFAPGLARFKYPDEGPELDIGKIFIETYLAKLSKNSPA